MIVFYFTQLKLSVFFLNSISDLATSPISLEFGCRHQRLEFGIWNPSRSAPHAACSIALLPAPLAPLPVAGSKLEE